MVKRAQIGSQTTFDTFRCVIWCKGTLQVFLVFRFCLDHPLKILKTHFQCLKQTKIEPKWAKTNFDPLESHFLEHKCVQKVLICRLIITISEIFYCQNLSLGPFLADSSSLFSPNKCNFETGFIGIKKVRQSRNIDWF